MSRDSKGGSPQHAPSRPKSAQGCGPGLGSSLLVLRLGTAVTRRLSGHHPTPFVAEPKGRLLKQTLRRLCLGPEHLEEAPGQTSRGTPAPAEGSAGTRQRSDAQASPKATPCALRGHPGAKSTGENTGDRPQQQARARHGPGLTTSRSARGADGQPARGPEGLPLRCPSRPSCFHRFLHGQNTPAVGECSTRHVAFALLWTVSSSRSVSYLTRPPADTLRRAGSCAGPDGPGGQRRKPRTVPSRPLRTSPRNTSGLPQAVKILGSACQPGFCFPHTTPQAWRKQASSWSVCLSKQTGRACAVCPG